VIELGREIILDNLLSNLVHFISSLGNINASVKERLVSFSLSFRKDVAHGD
jgi:hypothetical protein